MLEVLLILSAVTLNNSFEIKIQLFKMVQVGLLRTGYSKFFWIRRNLSYYFLILFVYLFVCLFFFPVLLKGFAFAQVESTILNILIALGLQWFNLCPLTSATPLCIWNTMDAFRHLPTCGFSNSPWVQQPHVLLRCHGYSMHSSPLKKSRLIWFRIE